MSTDTAVRTVADEQVPATGKWEIDPAHSSIEAVARHLMVSKVRGRFSEFSGTIHVAESIEDSRVEVEIDAASIDTRQSDRDAHLRSEDFLDVENHPTITFRSSGVKKDGDHWQMDGDLTIRGVTRPISLDVEFLGVMPNPFGGTTAAFSATTELDREDWDITWNQALETGGVLVGKSLKVEIDLQAGLAE